MMPRMKGRIETFAVPGPSLVGNALGDAVERATAVYLPPGYDADARRRYPVLYGLHGFTGSGPMWLNVQAWTPNAPERLDALIDAGEVPPCILVMVDGWTKLGGSQFVNSAAIGNYRDYVVRDVVAWADRTLRTVPSRDARAVFGKSSGGYGALVMGAHHADVFGAIACQSGDAYFEYCYLPDFPKAAADLRAAGSVQAWLDAFWRRARERKVLPADFPALNTVAMAAAYSPNAAAQPHGFDVPFDLDTGEMRDDVWRRWLEHDPVRFVPRAADAFRSLKLFFIDCGTRDQFQLHWGARIVVARARGLGIAVQHEEFDDDHTNIGYRNETTYRAIGRAFVAAGVVE